MATLEHRITPRFKLNTRLSFHRMKTLSEGEHQARAINISTRGVYFATNVILCIGEALEVLLEMPKRVTGVKAGIRRFAGRVTHIESTNMLQDFRESACNCFIMSAIWAESLNRKCSEDHSSAVLRLTALLDENLDDLTSQNPVAEPGSL